MSATAPGAAIALEAGDWRVEVVPDLGGGVARLTCAGIDVLRPAVLSADAAPSVETALGLGSFVMTPWVNRLGAGILHLSGACLGFPATFAEEPHALHGLGWTRSWTIAEHAPQRLALLVDLGADWPWRHRCAQIISVAPDGVSFALQLQNLGSEPMPASLGFHPYFPRQSLARIAFSARDIWILGDDRLPAGPAPAARGWDFSQGRAASGCGLDHCFAGWTGAATITWPDLAIVLESPDCRFLQVYTPRSEDYFCLEPQTAIPNAQAWPADQGGQRVLQAGEVLQAHLTLSRTSSDLRR